MYARINEGIIFILPSVAIGVSAEGGFFLEIAWLNFSVGIGAEP